jgi:predicted HAD superfamily Cof-like phosphohydrolase
MNLDTAYDDVKEFHHRFGHPVREAPTLLTAERAAARAAWMNEEVAEFLAAHTITDQADAMIDLIYFALGTLVEMGVRPEKLFEIVHAANMTKLWPDGAPRFRDDGKTVKPPTWVDPTDALCEEIERQARK